MRRIIKLETPRLLLCEVEEQDAAGFFALDSDPEVVRYVGAVPVERIAQSVDTIRYVQKQYAELGIGRWTVLLKENGEFVGWCGLKRVMEPVNGRADFIDIGYRLLRAHWGKGYATESAQAVLDHGFSVMGCAEIFAHAHRENLASQKVLTKIGMQRENEFEIEGFPCIWYAAANSCKNV